ncbi:hypothetical protein LCGC14_1501260 [marine sediment metagenome]|uniref:Uncharacterized protein n=1 Tax=marine sediment metagenome TaxID=412755 RepID=A0A0F9J416_9ZZZZ
MKRKSDLTCRNKNSRGSAGKSSDSNSSDLDGLCELPSKISLEDSDTLTISRWGFLDWNENGDPQTYEDALQNASNYLKNILDLNSFKDTKLTLANLSNLNLGDFASAIRNRKIKWLDIKENLDLNIYKLEFLNWKNNPNRSYKVAIENGAIYFLKNIYTTDFLERYKISFGIAPKSNQIKDYAYAFFITGLIYHHVLYSDIIKYLGFNFVQKSKWDLFSWSQNGLPRSYSEAVSNATLFFKNHIYPNIKSLLCLESNLAPTLIELRKNGYESFVDAIYDRDIKYSQIVEKSGLKFRPSLWSSFNWKNNPRTRDEAFNNIISYYRENINTEEFRNEYHIKDGFAPSLSMISNYYDNDFYSAIRNRGFGYAEIISYFNLRHSHITETPYRWGELSFSFDEEYLLSNNFIGKEILKYFNGFKEINFPFNIFENSQFRASHFQLRGDENNWVSYKGILDYFRDYISISNNQHDIQIRDYTNQFFQSFQNNYYRLPTHYDILPHIFEAFDFIVAVETPAFKYVSQLNRFYTGHMDLLGINNHVMTIYDLKRNISQILKGLPQFFCYYFLLDHSIKLINPNLNYEIRFVGLTPLEVYEIDCHSLKTPILNFVETNPYIKGRFDKISLYEAFKDLLL